MNVKYNINKIHGDLLNAFESVKIEEKSNQKLGNYFEISSVNEGMNVRMLVTKKNLESNIISWSYFENPLNENSDLVERISNIDNLSNDVKDIITKKRFSEEYNQIVKESSAINVGDIVETPDGPGKVIPNDRKDGNIWVELSDESKSNELTGNENVYLPSEVKLKQK